MARIVDLSTLRSEIAGTLMRDDLSDVIDSWIGLAHSRINIDLRTLEMVKKCRTLAESREVTLPTDWLEGKRIQTDAGQRLLVATLDELSTMRYQHTPHETLASDPGYAPVYSQPPEGYVCTGPRYYAVEGTWLELYPAPTPERPTTLEMTYYARVPELTESAPQNWLIRSDPGLYLYGALVHSAPYLLDDARIITWTRLYQAGVDALNARAEGAELSGSPINRRRHGDFWG